MDFNHIVLIYDQCTGYQKYKWESYLQGDTSRCLKHPVDFKTKVPFWPGLTWLVEKSVRISLMKCCSVAGCDQDDGGNCGDGGYGTNCDETAKMETARSVETTAAV